MTVQGLLQKKIPLDVSFATMLGTIPNKEIPAYTYKLEQGISSDRHGMMIITNEEIVDIIRGNLKHFTSSQK